MLSVVLCRTRAKGTPEESMAGLMFDGVKHRSVCSHIGVKKKGVNDVIESIIAPHRSSVGRSSVVLRRRVKKLNIYISYLSS